MANLTQEQWKEHLANDTNALVLDVRTGDEFSRGRIPNSINIDIYQGQGFVYKIDELDKSKNFYVYCLSGARSAQACMILNQLGVRNAYNLLGGIMEWTGEIDYQKVAV